MQQILGSEQGKQCIDFTMCVFFSVYQQHFG